MRLTLRTLLAYLDDTLEPSQAKLIGQKVAESDTAQELIARIKEVTRRRRITTPTASGAGAKVDPNSIAEYLDNELSPEQLAEVEQLALSSDVHLAEVAACHQILTLVLGEQALVPPTAYKRMYGLVKPPESNPNHRPPQRREADEAGPRETRDVDETLRLGLPALKAGSWANRLILLGGAAAVFVLLAFAIWNILPPGPKESDTGTTGPRVASGKALPTETDTAKKDKTSTKTETDTKAKIDSDTKTKTDADTKTTAQTKDKDTPKDTGTETKKDVVVKIEAPAPADTTVKDIAFFERPMPVASALLLQMQPDKKTGTKSWQRILATNPPTRIVTNSPLVSLPGYSSVVVLDSGVRLTLWGNIPEQAPIGWESLVVLHPSDKFDADLTLQRGRIKLTNAKEQPLKVRVRFNNPANPKKGEVWDLTLQDKGTEVVMVLLDYMPLGEPFFPDSTSTERVGPTVDVAALALVGKASLQVDLNAPIELAPPNDGIQHRWNSRMGPQDTQLNKGLPPWISGAPMGDPKVKAGFGKALDTLNTDLTSPMTSQSIDVGLSKAIKSQDIYQSRLAVRCLAAIDDIERLIEVLTTHKEKEVRWEAKDMLQVWIADKVNNDYVLFDTLQRSGYDKNQAAIFMQLLRNFGPKQLQEPGLYQALIEYLANDKPAIRELSYYHLWHLVPDGRKIDYSFNMPAEQRRQAVAQWKKLIPEGSLPPMGK
jgi:hypothetical protein